MTEQSRFDIRLMLAKGHWTLGEYDQALACIEASFEETGDVAQVSELLQSFQDDMAKGPANPEAQAKLEEWFEQFNENGASGEPSPVVESPILATPTMAQLMANQGLHTAAAEIAENVLRRNPADEQAMAVLDEISGVSSAASQQPVLVELERWLSNVRMRRTERGVPV